VAGGHGRAILVSPFPRVSRCLEVHVAAVSPAVDPEVLRSSRIDLAAALRAAALYGYNEGIDNHFSLAVAGRDDRFLLNRHGPHWSEIRARDILMLDLDGAIVDGDGVAETTAFVIHRGVHRARADARCVMHTHMPYATAVSMTAGGLETRISQNSMAFHGRVAHLSYGGLAEAEEEGERIGAAIRDGVKVVMMENHGVLAIGSSVADAWHTLYFLERACEQQVLAMSTGQELIRVSEEIASHTAAQWEEMSDHADLTFSALKREIDRRNPGYAE
jgi:ribulose-5-phosphate 4-epimerase/fuculose-1-phosphate aldolase